MDNLQTFYTAYLEKLAALESTVDALVPNSINKRVRNWVGERQSGVHPLSYYEMMNKANANVARVARAENRPPLSTRGTPIRIRRLM